jgi:serine/threonine-protein kinase SRPK3
MPLTIPGEFKYPNLASSEAITFSNLTSFLQGEDKRLFIGFASKMLRWLPEERLTAKELYNDPWLNFRPQVDQKGSG